MNPRLAITLVVIASALSPVVAAAGSLVLQCEGNSDVTSTLPKASHLELETISSTPLHTRHVGSSGDGESFQCSFIVPPDYDDTGDEPTIRFYGWVPPGQFCGSFCLSPNDVAWDIFYRVYVDGSATETSESSETQTNTAQLTADPVACGMSTLCFEDEVMYEFLGDITSDAGNFSPGDLVVLRAQRESDPLADYDGRFNVWLAAVEIQYPN